MKITLPTGLVVEGTPEQVTDIATKLGFGHLVKDTMYPPDTFYYSKSKGIFIRISVMATPHLHNALASQIREWALQVSNMNGPDFVKAVINGITDETFVAMLREYSLRSK